MAGHLGEAGRVARGSRRSRERGRELERGRGGGGTAARRCRGELRAMRPCRGVLCVASRVRKKSRPGRGRSVSKLTSVERRARGPWLRSPHSGSCCHCLLGQICISAISAPDTAAQLPSPSRCDRLADAPPTAEVFRLALAQVRPCLPSHLRELPTDAIVLRSTPSRPDPPSSSTSPRAPLRRLGVSLDASTQPSFRLSGHGYGSQAQ